MLQSQQRLSYLDGLRSFAIIQVVWFHLWIVSWYGADPLTIGDYTLLDPSVFVRMGYLGVETFLFLSACCLSIPVASTSENIWTRGFWKNFAKKRFFKIVPSYYLSIALVLLFGAYTHPNWSSLLRDLFSHLFFVHNLYEYTYNTINGIYWSLGLEVQFYLVFPALTWMFLKRPLLTTSILCAISIAFKVYYLKMFATESLVISNGLIAFLDTFSTGLLTGFALGRGFTPKSKTLSLASIALGVFGLCYCISTCYTWSFFPRGLDQWKTYYRLPYGLSLLLIILGLHGAGGILSRILGSRPFVFLSTISYNLYLWHGILFQEMLDRKIPIQRTLDIHQDPIWQFRYFWSCLFASLVVSTAMTYFFEIPIMKRYLSKKKTL